MRTHGFFFFLFFFFGAPFCTCPMLSSGSSRLTAALRAARPRECPPRRWRRPAGPATPGAIARAPAWLRAPRGLSTFGLALDLRLFAVPAPCEAPTSSLQPSPLLLVVTWAPTTGQYHVKSKTSPIFRWHRGKIPQIRAWFETIRFPSMPPSGESSPQEATKHG